MMVTRYKTPCLALLSLCLLCVGSPRTGLVEASDMEMIDLYPTGPQPQTLTIKAGTAVLWVSHLADTNLVVATVAFLEGQRVAQATTTLAGYNGFALEGAHFVGRMEGNGGKVALRFTAPGTYTYTIDHREHLTGTVVVQP